MYSFEFFKFKFKSHNANNRKLLALMIDNIEIMLELFEKKLKTIKIKNQKLKKKNENNWS